MHFQVPVELYRPIIEYTSEQRDLCAFCAVSRGFQQESERALYRNVRLTSDYARLVSWSQAMINNPRLAGFVYSLSIPSQTHSGIDPSRLSFLVQSMSKAIKALPNLKSLYIANSTSTSISQRFLHPSILRGCNFRLETFRIRSGYLALPDLLSFLAEQHEITYWRYEHRTLEGLQALSDDSSILPRLSCVYLCDWWILPYLVPRPIRRLRFRSVALNDDALPKLTNNLGLLKSLTHLSLDIIDLFPRVASEAPPLVKFLSQIEGLLPELRFLYMGGDTIFNFCDGDFQTLFDTLSRFRSLETFAVEVKLHRPRPRPAPAPAPTPSSTLAPPPPPKPPPSIHPRFRSHQSCSELAILFLAHCSPLRRVALIIMGDSNAEDWLGGRTGTICCVKANNGQIERDDHSDIINKEESWLTF